MRKLSVAVLAVLMLATLIGCGSAGGGYVAGQIEEAYSYVHGGYVGRAVVRVMDEGVLDVSLDEAFLPHTLGIVEFEDAEWTEANTAYYVSRGNEVRVAKYVEYDGDVYVGVTVGSGLSYVAAGENGEPAGGTDLEKAILRNQATMAAYFAGVQSGSFKILADFGGAAMAVTETHYGGVTKKNAPGYWNSGQTWIGNITAIEEFIEENGAGFPLSEMTRAAEEDANGLKFWSVADAVTGATNSDFKDYFGLVQSAIGRLAME